jgi:FtsH-binding integral membrane protein
MSRSEPAETHQERLERIANAGFHAYYEWLGQMLTLSAGALTVLVTFQDQLAGAKPCCLWLLQACWILLGIAVVAAAVALQGRHQAMFDMANQLHRGLGQGQTPLDLVGAPRRLARASGRALPTILAAALGCLTVFAVLNSGNR